jgi:hypothetical protein
MILPPLVVAGAPTILPDVGTVNVAVINPAGLASAPDTKAGVEPLNDTPAPILVVAIPDIIPVITNVVWPDSWNGELFRLGIPDNWNPTLFKPLLVAYAAVESLTGTVDIILINESSIKILKVYT